MYLEPFYPRYHKGFLFVMMAFFKIPVPVQDTTQDKTEQNLFTPTAKLDVTIHILNTIFYTFSQPVGRTPSMITLNMTLGRKYHKLAIGTIILLITSTIRSCVSAGEPETLIINGEIAPPDAYPWFVKGRGCGGSLISPEFVLTGS
jgi:hypothetical protein